MQPTWPRGPSPLTAYPMPIYIDEVANMLQLGLTPRALSIAGGNLRRLYRARYGTEPMHYSRVVGDVEGTEVILYHCNDMDLAVAALGDVLCSNERNVIDVSQEDLNNFINADNA